MRFHQVLAGASSGDAITNEAFELRALLRRLGPSEIFAHNIHPDVADEVIPLDRYGRYAGERPRLDMLLYHASIGEPTVHRFVLERPERVVLVYHNISPADAYAPYDPQFAGLLHQGRSDLVALRDKAVLALADSAFNAGELEALGYADVRVAPLIVDPTALHREKTDEETRPVLRARYGGPTLVFVGQLLPHKRPDLLVQAFHVLVTYLVPEATLLMVGPFRLPRFTQAVRDQVAELGLHGAWIPGPVAAATLRTCYEEADAFVTASEHEGFCVPLLEAMSFDLPVVARATSAVPETLGGAGLLVGPDDGVEVLAEAMAAALVDEPVRRDLVERGRQRLADFDPDHARATFLEHLADAV